MNGIHWAGTSDMHLKNRRWEHKVTIPCENYVEAIAKIALWAEEGWKAHIKNENGVIYAIGETSYAV